MKKTLLSLAAASLAVGLLLAPDLLAQSVPQVTTVDPDNDRMQIIPGGRPSAQSYYASPAQVSAVRDYYRSAPASLFTFTFENDQVLAAFDPAGTLDYGYVTMAPNPSDGTEACVFSTAAITTLYWTANTGQSINDAVTTLAANARNCYIYARSLTTWYRSQ